MRLTFSKTLLSLAKKNKQIILLTGDLGYSVFEKLKGELPQQYLNMGVAEQNMTGVAAGLAHEGFIPIIYSIVPFVTMRNFEQIRNDICYQNLNVKIVGVGAGFAYGMYGHTHYGVEDIGIMRTLSNMVILAPGDPIETKLATKASLVYRGPVYLRLGRAGESVVHKSNPEFSIGKGIIVRRGSRLSVITTSTMLATAVEVAKKLKSYDLSARVVSMPTVKPIDKQLLLDCARKTAAVFTLEEHSLNGGLGSAVAEVLAESSVNTKFRRFAIPDCFMSTIGDRQHMRDVCGLSVEKVCQQILKEY